MLNKLTNLIGLCLVLFGCNAPKSDTFREQEMVLTDSMTAEKTEAYTQNDQENVQRLIRLTLNELFKEDLEKGFLNSASRRFLYDQVDLNGDGNLEIFVGMTGTYFCGSGGCTIYLLSNQGDVITRFTVVDYPIYIDQESTNAWKNLIMYSGRENRRVIFDGQTYPSNPSVLEVYSGNLDTTQKYLEWDESRLVSF